MINSPPVTSACEPLGAELDTYDRSKQQPSRSGIPTIGLNIFADAMFVREEVFVREQGVPLENELDEEDSVCAHLVLYHRSGNGYDMQPAGTIRILPFDDRLPTHLDQHRKLDGSPYVGDLKSSQYSVGEAFITLGRLAIVKECRGRHWAELLVQHAFSYAKKRHTTLQRSTGHIVSASHWAGLITIHAQIQAQRFWERQGFEIDSEFGIWDEEGIDHIAMWSRIEIESKRNVQEK